MLRLKVLILIIFLTMIVGVGVSYIIHQKMAEQVIGYIPSFLHRLPPYVQVSYTDLKSDDCLFSVCLSARDVRVQLPGDTREKPFVFAFGTVKAERSLFGYYNLTTDGVIQPIQHIQSTPVSIALTADGTRKQGTVHSCVIQQNQFNTNLSGQISWEKQLIDLKGKSQNSLPFVRQFFPSDMQFMAEMLLGNVGEDISIDTDEDWIRVWDFPIVRKKLIFE